MSGTAQIGHNGGPRTPLPRKLSEAQANALRWIRDRGLSTYGLSGRSAFGGSSGTSLWLSRNGLAVWDAGAWRQSLTERGERVLAAGRMVD